MWPKFLKKEYPTERHLFLLPRKVLLVIGFDPETEPSHALNLWAFLNFLALFLGSCAELHYGIDHLRTNVPEAFDALSPMASSFMSLLKVYFIWLYRKDFKELMAQVRRINGRQHGEEKEHIKRKYYTLATQLTAMTIFFATMTSTIFTLRPLITNIIRYVQARPIIYETPFKMTFPASWLAMPIYPITFLFVTWHGLITPACFLGADGLFLGFCFYLGTFLKCLELDVRDVLVELTAEQRHEARFDLEVGRKLARLIDRHNEIAAMTQKFSQLIAVITLSHFVTSSLIVGISIIDILLFSGYGIVLYVVHTLAVLSELFLYCLGGNFIIDSSAALASRAYCSCWYTHSLRVQKMVLLLMVRAQRSFAVKIPFFSPSMAAYAAILKFSGSLIALAKSIL